MARLLSLALALTVLAGCDTTEPAPRTQAPLLPETFALSTQVFPSADPGATPGANYLNAATRVGVISSVVGLNLLLPVAATEAVTQASPTTEEDGDWVWSSTADVLGSPIGIRLEAAPAPYSEVAWRLETNRDGEEPFTYYTATTTPDGMTGAWSLFHPDEEGEVLTALFDVRELQFREITFTVPPGRENGGSSVRYSTQRTALTFDWSARPSGDRALIEWDAQGRAGSITASSYNGGARACWDAALQDVGC